LKVCKQFDDVTSAGKLFGVHAAATGMHPWEEQLEITDFFVVGKMIANMLPGIPF